MPILCDRVEACTTVFSDPVLQWCGYTPLGMQQWICDITARKDSRWSVGWNWWSMKMRLPGVEIAMHWAESRVPWRDRKRSAEGASIHGVCRCRIDEMCVT